MYDNRYRVLTVRRRAGNYLQGCPDRLLEQVGERNWVKWKIEKVPARVAYDGTAESFRAKDEGRPKKKIITDVFDVITVLKLIRDEFLRRRLIYITRGATSFESGNCNVHGAKRTVYGWRLPGLRPTTL